MKVQLGLGLALWLPVACYCNSPSKQERQTNSNNSTGLKLADHQHEGKELSFLQEVLQTSLNKRLYHQAAVSPETGYKKSTRVDHAIYRSQVAYGLQNLFQGEPIGNLQWMGADIAISIPDGVMTKNGSADLWIFGDVSGCDTMCEWPALLKHSMMTFTLCFV